MKRRAILRVTLCVLSAVAIQWLPRPGLASASPEPGDIVRAWADAIDRRDLDGLKSLLAADFHVRGFEGAPGCDATAADFLIDGKKRLFEAPNVSHFEFSFGDQFSVAPGPKPGTWVIDGITETLHMIAVPVGETEVLDVTVTDYLTWAVREAPGKETPFEIYEWTVWLKE
jgi:hypothetical protein